MDSIVAQQLARSQAPSRSVLECGGPAPPVPLRFNPPGKASPSARHWFQGGVEPRHSKTLRARAEVQKLPPSIGD